MPKPNDTRIIRLSHVKDVDGSTCLGQVEIRDCADGECWHAFIATQDGLVVLADRQVASIEPFETRTEVFTADGWVEKRHLDLQRMMADEDASDGPGVQ